MICFNLVFQDHPRIRGDYCKPISTNAKLAGSPPHTRGLPRIRRVLETKFRITPAYAGTTTGPAATNNNPQDHPRIRGDYTVPHTLPLQLLGSPPHTRGLPKPPTTEITVPRITPAYAGTTHHGIRHSRAFQDHPRIRGDY